MSSLSFSHSFNAWHLQRASANAQRGCQCGQHCHDDLNYGLPKFLVFHGKKIFRLKIFRALRLRRYLCNGIDRQLLTLSPLQKLLGAVAGTVVGTLGTEHHAQAVDVVGNREGLG